ncbi:hypothetical protein [Marinifilum sp. D737]|uniref:hypothetical protein n=1 Tax=Marinifilum sp. D737 TaxID=2969628 RepID=UPI002274AD52|nr:hypothetical protein [Marinifilum sp. D737]MCY1636751.1 hypothetical protein [Marinifilum sp. D737]
MREFLLISLSLMLSFSSCQISRDSKEKDLDVDFELFEFFMNCNEINLTDSIRYSPYEMFLRFNLKNTSDETLLFGSNHRKYSSEEKVYGIIELIALQDTIVFYTRNDLIEITPNDSLSITAEYNDRRFFNKFSKEKIYQLINSGELYYSAKKEDYKEKSKNDKYFFLERIKIKKQNNLKLFICSKGEVVEFYPKD